MNAPPCQYCGRRDTPFTSLWLRAQRQLRRQRAAIKELRREIVVARAGWDHEKAGRLDAEARERRASDCLDFLVAGRFDQIAKGQGGGA